jgi:hypothetical protein
LLPTHQDHQELLRNSAVLKHDSGDEL